jgi:hypothetical protein
MLMVPVHNMALAMTAVVIVSIDFPYDVFGVLLIQRTVWINARVYENAVPIEIRLMCSAVKKRRHGRRSVMNTNPLAYSSLPAIGRYVRLEPQSGSSRSWLF